MNTTFLLLVILTPELIIFFRGILYQILNIMISLRLTVIQMQREMIMPSPLFRDAMNSEEHIIIFNCVGWPDLGGGSAVSQFAMMARKFGKQLIVAVSEKDAIKLKDNFNIIGTLSYGKENFIAMSHTKSEFCS